jgi:DNA-binding MarR family transcriptional regulator
MKVRYVTPFQYQILTVCKDEYLSISTIAKQLNRKANTVAFTIKRMQEIEYIIQSKNNYKSANFTFFECTDVSTAKMRKKQDNEKFEDKTELKAFVPDEQTQKNVLKMYEAGLRRKEICKTLKMKPTEVLWTLIFLKDDSKSFEKETIIEMSEMEEQIYRYINLRNITISDILKKTKLTHDELKNHFHSLKKKGAIVIKNNKTHTEYIAIDCEIKKGEKDGKNIEYYTEEITVRADDCKRDCTCKSDNRKCGI